MHRTRVKICGITTADDALAAAEAGADAVGIVLQPGLPRSVSPAEARRIALALPPFVTLVGLFRDAELDVMRQAFDELKLNNLQLHGNESDAIMRDLFPIPFIKAVHVNETKLAAQIHLLRQGSKYSRIGYVLDTAAGGGSGIPNNWAVIRKHLGEFTGVLKYWIAAGGLTPQTVGPVIRDLRPYAVDVSSGVEKNKREKSPDLMRRFIDAVREADAAIG